MHPDGKFAGRPSSTFSKAYEKVLGRIVKKIPRRADPCMLNIIVKCNN